MLLWPSVALLGFLLLAALVVALATRSTEQYEFERNQVQNQRQQAAAPAEEAAAPAEEAAVPADAPALAAVASPAGAQEARVEPRATVGMTTHPAGKRRVQPGDTPSWWLVEGQRAVAGPFADRIEADWSRVTSGRAGAQRVVYGVQRADGGVARRQLPQERAWLAELGAHLDRLGPEWDELLSDDEDELVTLVVEVTAALVEAGLPLHDCAGATPAGGVCLSPEAGRHGVVVSWHQHERMSHDQVRGAATGAALQSTMNDAVADCLHTLGFRVEPFGSAGCSLVLMTEPDQA